MQDKPTKEIDEILNNLNPGEFTKFLKDNRRYMADEKKAFSYYFKDVLATKHIFQKDVFSFAGVSESYGSKIVNMERHTKDRDLIIRLCIAGHFFLDEINRALKLYGMVPLYAKNKRDACLIVSINNRIYDLAKLDDILEEHGFARLSAEE